MSETTTRPGSNKIGELNGGWAMMLKLLLLTYPVLLTWGVWVTSETFANRAFRNAGDRFTNLDAKALELKLARDHHGEVTRLEAMISKLPPDDWRERILRLEVNQIAIQENQIKILAKLDSMAP